MPWMVLPCKGILQDRAGGNAVVATAMGKAAEMSLTLVGPSPSKKRKKRKKKKKQVCGYIRVDLSSCRYQILRIALRKLGWEAVTDDCKPWHLIWTDTSIGPDKLMMLKRGQKINHFVGMLEICRKKALARNLSMMRKIFPAAYKFFPKAYILPNQLTQFLTRFNSPKPRTYILKPDNGSMGRGVVLVQTSEEVKHVIKGLHGANFVAQKYLTKPMLLNGYKFDLRIYVLILSCNPLRLYLYKEGLARFCTEKYMKPDHKNLKVSRMHLTNYSLNKYSSNFEFNSSTAEVNKGSKWTLTALYKALAAQGFDVNQLDMQIKRMVVLTVIAIVPVLAHSYKTCLNEDDNGRSCFELLGLDVLVDEKCKPWLLEVNHSPSFSIDTPLDHMVKEALILDTLKLVNVDPGGISKSRMEQRRDSQIRLYGKLTDEYVDESPEAEISTERTQTYDEYELENMGNFDRIYPTEDADLQNFYDRCLAGASELFTHSFDMKVKKEIAKVQEEKRQEELEKQAADKRRKELEVRKKAREAARNVALSRKQSFSRAAKEAKGAKKPSKAVATSPSPALSTPKSSIMLEIEESVEKLADSFDEIPERIGEKRPGSVSARSFAGDNTTATLNSLLCSSFDSQVGYQVSPRTITVSPLSVNHHHHQQRHHYRHQHCLEFCTGKNGSSTGHALPAIDPCLTTRGFVKSISSSMPETRCAHCQKQQGRALASKNANLLPMTLNEMTTLASSFLTNRWSLEKTRPLALKKSTVIVPAVNLPETMRAQFRSKLFAVQRSGPFLASHSALLKKLPWDSSTSCNKHRQKLNMMLEATHLSPTSWEDSWRA